MRRFGTTGLGLWSLKARRGLLLVSGSKHGKNTVHMYIEDSEEYSMAQKMKLSTLGDPSSEPFLSSRRCASDVFHHMFHDTFVYLSGLGRVQDTNN